MSSSNRTCIGGRHVRLSVAVLLALVVNEEILVQGHPGAIANGRASCGEEFNTASTAFSIPDITESWYVRRTATCTYPFFWVKFDAEANRKVALLSQAPLVDGYEDKLNFNAIIFGPSFDKSYASDFVQARESFKLPEAVDGLDLPDLGAKVVRSPAAIDDAKCFITNPVMRNYANVIDGRCSENITFSKDFKLGGLAGKSWMKWWLSDDEMKPTRPGTHYVLMWLSDRKTNEVATGRYEITIGPPSWSTYASDSLQSEARSQTTTCSCSINNAHYHAGQNLDMLGYPHPELLAEELPYQTCGFGADGSPTKPAPAFEHCKASAQSQKVDDDDDSPVEWAGTYTLDAGTYDWDFYAYKEYEEWSYPDAAMEVVVIRSDTVEAVESKASVVMANSLEGTIVTSEVKPLETIRLEEPSSQVTPSAYRVLLTNMSLVGINGSKSVTFKVEVKTGGTFAFFTQHRPSEFLAEQLTKSCLGQSSSCGDKGSFVYWNEAKTYGNFSTQNSEIKVATRKYNISYKGIALGTPNPTTSTPTRSPTALTTPTPTVKGGATRASSITTTTTKNNNSDNNNNSNNSGENEKAGADALDGVGGTTGFIVIVAIAVVITVALIVLVVVVRKRCYRALNQDNEGNKAQDNEGNTAQDNFGFSEK